MTFFFRPCLKIIIEPALGCTVLPRLWKFKMLDSVPGYIWHGLSSDIFIFSVSLLLDLGNRLSKLSSLFSKVKKWKFSNIDVWYVKRRVFENWTHLWNPFDKILKNKWTGGKKPWYLKDFQYWPFSEGICFQLTQFSIFTKTDFTGVFSF